MRLVTLGQIVKPHGVRGELKVRLYWAGSDTLQRVDSVVLALPGQEERRLQIEAVRAAPKGALLKLEGVDDRDRAETLRGAGVAVPRDALPELEEGEYYLCDLVGATVVGPSGPIGEVVEVRVHPSVDCLVIRLPDGKTLEQPLAEPWIDEVDVEASVVRLASTDGLM